MELRKTGEGSLIDSGGKSRISGAEMRYLSSTLALALSLQFGCGSYLPAPRGYRTDCSSGGYARSTKYGTFANGSSTCEEFPPEICHPQHPSYREDVAAGVCRLQAEHRERHNSKVRTGRTVGWIAVGALVLVGTIVGAGEEGGSEY